MEFKFEPDTRNLWDRLTYLDCCGIKELSRLKGLTKNLGSSENVAKAVAKIVVGQVLKSAFLVFSEVRGGGTYGTDLKAFILAKGLGTVTQSKTVENPNSGNYITVYLWWMDRNALKTWHEKFAPDDPIYKTILPQSPTPPSLQCPEDGCFCSACVRAGDAEVALLAKVGANTTSIPTTTATSIPF